MNCLVHVVEWADLPLIDLSQAKTSERRIVLANQVRDALATTGFFYVVNHGYTPEQAGLKDRYMFQFLIFLIDPAYARHCRYPIYTSQ